MVYMCSSGWGLDSMSISLAKTQALTRYDTTFLSGKELEAGGAHFHVCHLSLSLLALPRPPPPPTLLGESKKSRSVVRAKLIMAMGQRLIPIALLSAPCYFCAWQL